MVESRQNILKGTLDMLILKTLSLTPLHGLGISRRLEQITNGVFQVKPGSLFPALHRMEPSQARREALMELGGVEQV